MKKFIKISSLISMLVFLAVMISPIATAQEVDGSNPCDPDIVYIEIRPALDETIVTGLGVPTRVLFPAGGIFWGYSLPIWNNNNEELYFRICVPARYDEANDIMVEVTSALSNAGEAGNSYRKCHNRENVDSYFDCERGYFCRCLPTDRARGNFYETGDAAGLVYGSNCCGVYPQPISGRADRSPDGRPA